MKTTSALAVSGIVALALFAIENGARAQSFPGPAWPYLAPPPLLQWIYPPQPPRSGGWYLSQPQNYSNSGAPGFQPGSRGENRPAFLTANQSGGVCRRRSSARGVELQRNGF